MVVDSRADEMPNLSICVAFSALCAVFSDSMRCLSICPSTFVNLGPRVPILAPGSSAHVLTDLVAAQRYPLSLFDEF